jgi:hypothetical protein
MQQATRSVHRGRRRAAMGCLRFCLAAMPVNRAETGPRSVVDPPKSVMKRWTLPKPASNGVSASGRSVSDINRLAACTRRVPATSTGEAPTCSLKSRERCRVPTPRLSDNSSTECRSRKPSPMSRIARATVVAAAPRHAGLPGAVSGRHLRHGRKPIRSAAAALGTKKMFAC